MPRARLGVALGNKANLYTFQTVNETISKPDRTKTNPLKLFYDWVNSNRQQPANNADGSDLDRPSPENLRTMLEEKLAALNISDPVAIEKACMLLHSDAPKIIPKFPDAESQRLFLSINDSKAKDKNGISPKAAKIIIKNSPSMLSEFQKSQIKFLNREFSGST